MVSASQVAGVAGVEAVVVGLKPRWRVRKRREAPYLGCYHSWCHCDRSSNVGAAGAWHRPRSYDGISMGKPGCLGNHDWGGRGDLVLRRAMATRGDCGYLTGRLRTKWVWLRSHEVFFRDTAHGFLAWALALLVSWTAAGIVGAARGVSEAAAGRGTRSWPCPRAGARQH